MADYGSWSLSKLKDAANSVQTSDLESASRNYQHSAQFVSQLQPTFKSAVTKLSASWHGQAAQSAVENATTAYATMSRTKEAAQQSHSDTESYIKQVHTQKQQVAAIEDVDTSWGHAAKSGGMAGAGAGPFGALVGTIAAQQEAQHKYDEHRAQAAEAVAQMDSDGQSHAGTMRAQNWPASTRDNFDPPGAIPTPPQPKGAGGGPPPPPMPSPGPAPAPTPVSPVWSGPSGNGGSTHGPTTHGGGSIAGRPVTGGGSGSGSVTTPPTTGVNPQGGGWAAGGGLPTEGSGAVGPIPGTANGGAAAAALGGAGLLAAGGVAGRGAVANGVNSIRNFANRGGGTGIEGRGPNGGRGANAGGDAEGRGAHGARGGAAGESESRLGSGARGTGAGVDAEGRVGSGARGGSGGLAAENERGMMPGARGAGGFAAGEQEAAPNRYARSGFGSGFDGEGAGARPLGSSGALGGEPLAEAGRPGGYPMGGGGGARRRDDEDEAKVPDYLVETEDVWGDGVVAAPPVIGE